MIGSNNTVFLFVFKKAFLNIVISEIADLHYQTDKFSLIIFPIFLYEYLDAEDQREAFRILLEKLEHNGEIILNLELLMGDKFLKDPSISSFVCQTEIDDEIFIFFTRQGAIISLNFIRISRLQFLEICQVN